MLIAEIMFRSGVADTPELELDMLWAFDADVPPPPPPAATALAQLSQAQRRILSANSLGEFSRRIMRRAPSRRHVSDEILGSFSRLILSAHSLGSILAHSRRIIC